MVSQVRWIMTKNNHPSSSTSPTPGPHTILAKLKVKFSQGELLDVDPTAATPVPRKGRVLSISTILPTMTT